MSIKTERLNAQIQRELTLILRDEVKDSTAKKAIITEVDTTNDLSYAKVYVTFHDHPKRGLEALERSKGFIKRSLSRKIHTRKCPELIFKIDEVLNYGNHIEDLIREIHKND